MCFYCTFSLHHFIVTFAPLPQKTKLFNEINARSIGNDANVFRGITKNPWFLTIILVTIITQYFIVTYGGGFTKTCPLSVREWVITTTIGALSLPIGVLMRFMPSPDDVDDNPGGDWSKKWNQKASSGAEAEWALEYLLSPEMETKRRTKTFWDWFISAMLSFIPAYVIFVAIVSS